MHPDPSFEPLAAAEGGPSSVVRQADTILRPVQPWTPTIPPCCGIWRPSASPALRGWSVMGMTGAATKCSPGSRASCATRTPGATTPSGRSADCSASCTTPRRASIRPGTQPGSRGTSTATRRARSSATATPGHGTSWPATACQSDSSTGPWPGRPTAATRSRPQPGGTPNFTTTSPRATNCRTRRPGGAAAVLPRRLPVACGGAGRLGHPHDRVRHPRLCLGGDPGTGHARVH